MTLLEPKEFRKQHAAHMAGGAQDLVRSNLAHMERVLALLPRNPVVIEIGCWKGGTTVWLLEHGVARVDVIDPFTGNPEHKDVDGMAIRAAFYNATRRFGTRVRCFPTSSLATLTEFVAHSGGTGGHWDLVYVDGSHDSRDVITDMVLGFRLLKSGGILVADDYLWSYYDEPYRNPKPAIDFFLGAFAGQFNLIESGYQVSIQKK